MRPCAVCASVPGAARPETIASNIARNAQADLYCRVIVDSPPEDHSRYLLGLLHTPTCEQRSATKMKHLLRKEFYKPDSSVPAATKTLTCVRAMMRKLSDTRPPSRATCNLAPNHIGASMRDAS